MESNRTLRRAGSGPAPTFNIEEAARFLALLDSERDTHIFARGTTIRSGANGSLRKLRLRVVRGLAYGSSASVLSKARDCG